jgi:hypothetical protein
MRKRSTGGRFNLDEPWNGQLDDFCAAHFAGSAKEVVQAALDVFIPIELKRDKATAERYKKLQTQRRTSGRPPKV